ncbi:MAG TPA: nucleotidyltransferase family protein [Burkholderiales bacterium]|jgi:MurNAc alpha-1-phosphate uridylyltransferase|nr:nucleotidyltransferase family protein [Burkholderiales bacterium]
MKAMLLAAGRGERMRPLTDTTPKALLGVGGKPLIVWHLERLQRAGFSEIVINLAHLGDQIEAALQDGREFRVNIVYSREGEALETAGGIVFALPLLGNQPFIVVNADIYCEFDFSRLRAHAVEEMAHLVLVDNPPHHPRGDFALLQNRVAVAGVPMLTFSGIGVYRPELFSGIARGTKAPLAPLLRRAMVEHRVTGERYSGIWRDVGTPERLKQLDMALARKHG